MRQQTHGGLGLLLNENALFNHQNRYHQVGQESPYISTSAGTYVEEQDPGDADRGYWRARFALDTAIIFATLLSERDGRLGLPRLPPAPRASGRCARGVRGGAARPAPASRAWSTFRAEGEVAGAVRIPSRRLRRADLYRYADVVWAVERGLRAEPILGESIPGPAFVDPSSVLGVRAVI